MGRILQLQPEERVSMKTPNRFSPIWLGPVLSLAAMTTVSPALFAQSQENSSPSVAEAARKAKEQKKGPTKDTKVITEDTIRLRPASADSGAPPAGTVVTSSPAADRALPPASAATPNAASSGSTAGTGAAQAADPKKREEQNAEVAKAKELLAQAMAELDVLKRELALDSDNYFSNPDYAHDTAGKGNLDELQRMIGDKQVSVEDLKRQLSEVMQKAGVSAEADKAPAPPKN